MKKQDSEGYRAQDKAHARATLTTAEGIVAALDELYSAHLRGEVDASEMKARAYVLQCAGSVHRTAVQEARLGELHDRLTEIEERRK